MQYQALAYKLTTHINFSFIKNNLFIMKTRRLKFLSYLLMVALVASCSPEDGEDGTIGPQGLQGEQGPAGAEGMDGTNGADGAQGEQGEPGAANVIYSSWIDSEFDENIISTSASFSIDAPLMTNEIINEGVILVFGRSRPFAPSTDTDVYALPIVFGASRQQSYYFRAEQAEELDIVVAAIEQGDPVGSPFFEAYRYILIPGEQPADTSGPGGLGSKTEAVDYAKMTYEEIIEHLNIPE